MTHLAALEDEAIFILRETVATRERPVLLFSAGKDSIALLHLAVKAFRPARLPLAVMHVDTGHNFPEAIAFRDRHLAALGVPLVVASVEESIARGRVVNPTGIRASRNALQSVTLLDAIAEHKFDVAFGGGRRDEDRARAKERIVSVRDASGGWDPKNQRAELFGLLNTRIRAGEHLRVFPISNFTEVDVWEYIRAEGLEVPPIYFAHTREVFERDGLLQAAAPFVERLPSERTFSARVRFRTIGDMTCTGAIRSSADGVDAILDEIRAATITERGATRADDRFSEAAMEDRKREGYF
ncbi:MAG TPA: sulfate adenylyltransferase subunit CysD [Polyangiaceae bacterium]|jgi:sulfate adenylyltransferase subunit 2